MDIIEWDEDSFSVRVPSVDAQHRKLFAMINDLYAGMNANATMEVLEKLLVDLWNYTQEHFRYEEKLQQQADYPQYYEHKMLHDDLRSQVVEFQQKFINGEAKLDREIIAFLVKWLMNHIAVADRAFSDLMVAREIK